MTSRPRVILIVLDGCGAGAAPDACEYGDCDSPSTIKHVWEACRTCTAPQLGRLGLLAACGIGTAPDARYGRLRPMGKGKDSVTGHWEMMGARVREPFPTYPNGFPPEVLEPFQARIGREVLGNRPASGTRIIQELGTEHIRTGRPIVYTSADSVFQIACHESVVPVAELYAWCSFARQILTGEHNVQRVIARPFDGDAVAGFERTPHRRDFPVPAPHNLVDDVGDVFGIGVVPELFAGRGFRKVRRTQNNLQHEELLFEAMSSDARFIFANFEDFDMLYGHRNDVQGFAKALERFDQTVGHVLARLEPRDLLILTADHGNDPTSASSDHTREYVPVCLAGAGVTPARLGDVEGFEAIGATVAAHLGVYSELGRGLLGSATAAA